MSIPTMRIRLRDRIPDVGHNALGSPVSHGSSCFRYCDFDHMCDRNRKVGGESRARSVEADRTIAARKRRQDFNSYGGSQ